MEDNMEESDTEVLWSISLLRVWHLRTSSQEHHLLAFVYKALAPNGPSSLACILGMVWEIKISYWTHWKALGGQNKTLEEK